MSDSNGPKVPKCKVILLGDCGVGKTSIIFLFIYCDFYSNGPSSIGSSYLN